MVIHIDCQYFLTLFFFNPFFYFKTETKKSKQKTQGFLSLPKEIDFHLLLKRRKKKKIDRKIN